MNSEFEFMFSNQLAVFQCTSRLQYHQEFLNTKKWRMIPSLPVLRSGDSTGEPNFNFKAHVKARTIFVHFQNAGRQDATRESITEDDSLTEY